MTRGDALDVRIGFMDSEAPVHVQRPEGDGHHETAGRAPRSPLGPPTYVEYVASAFSGRTPSGAVAECRGICAGHRSRTATASRTQPLLGLGLDGDQ